MKQVITPDMLEPVACPKCLHDIFRQRHFVKYVSHIHSPAKLPMYIGEVVWICNKCDYVLPRANDYVRPNKEKSDGV